MEPLTAEAAPQNVSAGTASVVGLENGVLGIFINLFYRLRQFLEKRSRALPGGQVEC
jgi:hypothetical protein